MVNVILHQRMDIVLHLIVHQAVIYVEQEFSKIVSFLRILAVRLECVQKYLILIKQQLNVRVIMDI
jgi:hypothetical protein